MEMNNTTDTSSSGGTDMSNMMMMKAYLHFTKGDTVLFDTIVPSSNGAIVGTCIILCGIAVLERWFCAFTRGVQKRFQVRSEKLIRQYSTEELEHTKVMTLDGHFVLSQELVRGGLTGINTTLHYLLMLVVMTFNASFIISVIIGAVIGEIAFGRLNR